MMIRFTKRDNKQDILSCTRDDGSVTWAKDRWFFVPHDLIHYAVETTFGFKNAFYGLLAQGWDIGDFGVPDKETGRKPAIPVEAGMAEAIVGFLQLELMHPQDDFGTVRENVEKHCAQHGIPAPDTMSDERVNRARQKARRLLKAWGELPNGESLTLPFDHSVFLSSER